MIPILYSSTETTFTSNGIGRLAECTSCIVTEERNGQFELEFVYPITGKYYSQIQNGMIVSATHDDSGDRQPFRIYRKSAPIDGLVTFNAHHISYDLNHIILHPMTAISATDAFDAFSTETTPANPFTFWTDVTTQGEFTCDVPSSIRSVLGGTEGSILDVYGGEYRWDNRTVRLYKQRGQKTDITIRYGKNLTGIKQEIDTLDNYTGIVPFWYDEESETLVVLPDWYVLASGQTVVNLVTMDFSDQWEEAPTTSALRQKALSYLDNNKPYVPDENIKISFTQLWQTDEYKDVAVLQRLQLCDKVNVYYPALGITAENVEIIKVVYNVLQERYDEMELGDAKTSLSNTILNAAKAETVAMTKNFATKNRVKVELLALQNNLQLQIDAKIQTWRQASDPASAWTTSTLKAQHDGDLWCYTGTTTNTRTQYGTYRYSYDSTTQTGTWVSYSATDELFDAIDGKTTIFYGSPTGTYTGVQTNDYLVDPSTSKTYRWSGSAWAVVTDYTSEIDTAIQNATQLITGGMGGNIVFVYDADGKPIEMLIMDTADTATAVHVLRINVNGIGFSSTGINGPYTSAWTLDGQFVADFITAGSLSANLITSGTMSADLLKGGTLKLGSSGNVNGTLEVYDANNNLIGTWDNNGINAIGDLAIKVGLQETRSIEDGYIFYYDSVQGMIWGHHAAFYTRWRSATTGKVISQSLWTQGGSIWQEVNMTINAQCKRIVFTGCDVTDLSDSTKPTTYTQMIETVGDNVYTLELRKGSGSAPALHMKSGSSQYVALGERLGSQTVQTSGSHISIEADLNGFHVLGGTHYIRVGDNYRQIDGNTIQVTSSSKRYKHDITDQINDELDPHRLYDLKMKQFVYNDDHEPPYACMKDKTVPGFIAEDVAEVYPAAVISNPETGEIESWSEAQIIPGMLALIQEQKKTVDDLEARVAKLEAALEKLI